MTRRLDSDSKIADMEIEPEQNLGILDDVVAHFVHCANVSGCDDLTNLKLQSLVFYAQGFHLALYDKPLFENKIYAWTTCAVCPDLYYKYKEYNDKQIPIVSSKDLLNDVQKELLNDIWFKYGRFSQWFLNQTIKEYSIWNKHEKDVSEITQDEMREFF